MKAKTRYFMMGLIICLVQTYGCAAAAGEPVDTAVLLRNLYDLDQVALLRDSSCTQFSSYDRYETNADVGNYLAIDENRTAVLADIKGPGAIVRIWTPTPQGTLKIYLDDQPTPVIDCPFASFFEDPQFAPVRIHICGGYTSYWPIPYAKSCKVIVEKPGNYFYWQITCQTYPAGTTVETHTNDLTPSAKAELDKVLQAWRNPADFALPRTSKLGDFDGIDQTNQSLALAPGENSTVFSSSAPGCIDSILIKTSASITDLKKTVIRAYWDQEKNPSIESPIPDFFGSGYANMDLASLPMVMKRGDYCLCRFPMPFAKSANIQIENGSENPLPMEVIIENRKMKNLAPNTAYFHARWHREITQNGIPFTILTARGQGRFVGCTLTMQGGDRGASYQEGDELIFVDGEKTPSLHGTGTEDYFNCGYYFAGGPAPMPLYGATQSSFDGVFHYTSAYRFHVPDAIPFTREIAVQLEHGFDLLGYDWTLPDKPKTDKWCFPGLPYSCTTYYYQKSPQSGKSNIPSARNLEYFRTLGAPARDAVEAEDWNPQATGGQLQMKKWDDLTDDIRGTIVPTLIPETADAALHFTIPVKYRDRYEIIAFLAKGKDYGKFTCMVGGQTIGQPDLYADVSTIPSGPISLGVAVLEPSDNSLTLKISGPNPQGRLPKIGVDRFLLQSHSPWILDWQVIGPFDNKGFDIALPPGASPYVFNFTGIDEVFPPETDGFIASNGYQGKAAEVTWKRVAAEGNGHVDLAKHLGLAGESNTGYLFTRIFSPAEMDTEMNVAPSDSLKVWLNNREIFRCELVRDQNPGYGCWMPIHLQKGENLLLLKVTHSLAAFWGCFTRIRDAENTIRYDAAP